MAILGQRRVGSYQLISLIRAGHLCEIWKVQRADEQQRFAMKFLPMGPGHNREQIGYLKHEFLIGRNLTDEGVIRIYDFGTAAEGSYLVMELYHVPNLKQRIQAQGVERLAYQAEEIIRRSAKSLHYLHEQGWVHCDVKPDNYLVGDDAQLKLIDFSLAQKRKGRLARLITRRTKVRGTKSYMSPEQIRGQTVDERTDVYSLGCVIHELVGGKLPFTGTSVQELLTKHLRSKAPSLQSINRDVDPGFSELVSRMIAKDPDRRPATMQVFLDELAQTRVFQQPPKPLEDAH